MSNTIQRTLSAAAVLACLGTVALAAPQKKKAKKGADPVVAHVQAEAKKANVSRSDPDWKKHLPMPEIPPFEDGKVYTWHLETSEGPVDVELMPKVAPRHVSCTLFLTEVGFYDDLSFHRVITGFMAQGGCPIGNGTGNPGFRYDGEFAPDVKHDRPGLLSMANAGPGTDGSQFFLTFVPTPHLDGKHTIFGEAKGEASFATLKKLEAAGSRSGATSKPLKIVKATWSAKEWRAPLPDSPDSADAALAQIAEWTGEQAIDKSKKRWKTKLPKPPVLTFDAEKSYFWNLETSKGVIRVKLMPSVAPMHVSSTIFLSRLGYYDDLIFHRVIPGFMAQGGCPSGNGRGGPGYKYDGEFSPDVRHDRPGLLSMANAGPGTDGSQFFLTFVPTPHLDGKHSIFGEVVEGLDVLKALEAKGSRSGRTSEKLELRRTTISVE